MITVVNYGLVFKRYTATWGGQATAYIQNYTYVRYKKQLFLRPVLEIVAKIDNKDEFQHSIQEQPGPAQTTESTGSKIID